MLSPWFQSSSVYCQTSASSSQPLGTLRYFWAISGCCLMNTQEEARSPPHKRSALGPSCSPPDSRLISTVKWNDRGSFLFTLVWGMLLESSFPIPELPFSQDDWQWENLLSSREIHVPTYTAWSEDWSYDPHETIMSGNNSSILVVRVTQPGMTSWAGHLQCSKYKPNSGHCQGLLQAQHEIQTCIPFCHFVISSFNNCEQLLKEHTHKNKQ